MGAEAIVQLIRGMCTLSASARRNLRNRVEGHGCRSRSRTAVMMPLVLPDACSVSPRNLRGLDSPTRMADDVGKIEIHSFFIKRLKSFCCKRWVFVFSYSQIVEIVCKTDRRTIQNAYAGISSFHCFIICFYVFWFCNRWQTEKSREIAYVT